MESNRISLNPSSIVLILGTVAFFLVLDSTAGQLTAYVMGCCLDHWIVQLFSLDAEQNIPTFFSSFLLLFASLLLAVISMLEKNRSASGVSYWAILSLGFLFMVADEQFCFHERLMVPMQKLLGDSNLVFFYYAWVIPYIALVFILTLSFFKFWWRLPTKTRLIFLVAAVTYLGGCIGFELIGGYYDKLYGHKNLTYIMFMTIEESLEMAGVIIFIWGLLQHIAENYKEVGIRFIGDCEKA